MQVNFRLNLGLLLLRRELLLVMFRLLHMGWLMLRFNFLLSLHLGMKGRCRLLRRSRLRVMLTGELPLVGRGLSLHPTFATIETYSPWPVANGRLLHKCIVNAGSIDVVHSRII